MGCSARCSGGLRLINAATSIGRSLVRHLFHQPPDLDRGRDGSGGGGARCAAKAWRTCSSETASCISWVSSSRRPAADGVRQQSSVFMIYNLVGVDPLDRGATALKTRGLLTEWKPVLVSPPCGSWALLSISHALASMTNPPLNWGYPRTGRVSSTRSPQHEQTNPTSSLTRFVDQVKDVYADGAIDEFTAFIWRSASFRGSFTGGFRNGSAPGSSA